MRRNRKSNVKKERIIMIASSTFVLAALTLTGVYMSGKETESKDDGYTLDFTALEENAGDKLEEIAGVDGQEHAPDDLLADGQTGMRPDVVDGELDYMPLEVGSGQITIPGLTDQQTQLGHDDDAADAGGSVLPRPGGNDTEAADENDGDANDGNGIDGAGEEDVASGNVAAPERTLSFSTEDGLLRPLSGDILMHYSMSSSIYFATLDQYKYNPAVIISAEQGTPVSAGAEGKVVAVYEDAVLGKALQLDLGNGYQATYGQLTDVSVSEGSYVEEGDILGYVAAPTKYYSVEGANLYFALTKDGAPVNPEVLFR